jgi:hypothetical protein
MLTGVVLSFLALAVPIRLERVQAPPEPKNLPGVYVGSIILKKFVVKGSATDPFFRMRERAASNLAKGQVLVIVIQRGGTCEVFWADPKDHRAAGPKATGAMCWTLSRGKLSVSLENLTPPSIVRFDMVVPRLDLDVSGDVLRANDHIGYVTLRRVSPATWGIDPRTCTRMTPAQALHTRSDIVHPFLSRMLDPGPAPQEANLPGVYFGTPVFPHSSILSMNSMGPNDFYKLLYAKSQRGLVYYLVLYKLGHCRVSWFSLQTSKIVSGPYEGIWTSAKIGGELHVDVQGLPRDGRLTPGIRQNYIARGKELQIHDPYLAAVLRKLAKQPVNW